MKVSREKSLARNTKLLAELVDQLKVCRYFRTMPREILEQVLREGKYLEVPAETVLIKDNALDDDLFFLVEGALKVLSGKKLVLRLDTPGDIVGEFAVVSDSPRSADVLTEQPSRLIRVSSSVVKTQAEPERALQFYNVFSHIMAAKLRETSGRARLYEDAVLEAKEMARGQTRLEGEIEDKLQEILLYSKVIESSQDAVLITDTEHGILRYNPAAHRLASQLKLGRIKSKMDARKLVDGFDLGDYPAHPLGEPWSGEWVRGEGDDLTVLQVVVTPFHGQNQALVNVAYQIRDISLERAQENAIAAKNEEIQKALLDLEATYQELQRSDKLKSETLTTVSNELIAPVRKILNHAAKINQTLEDQPQPEVVGHIKAIAEQAEFLKVISENITQLIDLQVDLAPSTFDVLDISTVLRQVVDELTPRARQRKVTFDLDLPDEPLTLNGNAEQFRVVFNVLFEQAMVVGRRGSHVQITGRHERGSELVHVEAVYDGESLSALSPSSANEARMGLVVGLPLARKVVSHYQGSLQFMSLARQARISVLLPRTQKLGDERPNRILICDENDMDRLIIQGMLENLWPDSVIHATQDPFEFLDNYEDFRPDLVIIDPRITEPGWSNHRVLASLVHNRRHACPVLSISTLYNDFAERTIAVERGVTDFLPKPYSIFDLQFKVKSMLQSHRKEESLHQTMSQAQRQAFTDGLTKLANRKNFDGFLETQINYSQQTGKPCSLIMLDIDNFKHYNDTNGHQLGDEILKGVARILAKSVRSSDLAARYGGEEFVVVLPETKKDMAAVIAEKMRRTVQETAFPKATNQPLGFLSASFGVSTYDEDGDAPETLLKAADDCLYVAKEAGRNQVVLAPGKAKKSAPRKAGQA